ncbi:TlpA family protein disulfide reductase [Flagellimonas sp.]|uniref:TlpA family protein disulfide reductase n=1 Tax=Flagellimonas sp. TaxID=2058762 RepID=UPI003BAB1A7B
MKTYLIGILIFCLSLNFINAQEFRLDDPNLILKDSSGNIITAKQAEEILRKGSVSFQTVDLGNGKQEIILKPVSNKSLEQKDEENNQWKSKWTNAKLPPFELYNISGKKIENDDLLGKYVVVNFWFVGCKPCIQEMPMLNKLVKKYTKDQVVFIAPSLDGKSSVTKMLEKRDFEYEILTDAKSLSKDMGLSSYPTHLIIDKEGNIKEILIGASEDIFEDLDTLLSKVMASDK